MPAHWMSKSLLRSGAIYALANVLSAAVPFFLLPILTRVMSPSEYGQVIAFFMVAAIAGSTAGLSLHGAIYLRWVGNQASRREAFTGTALVLAALSTAATMAFAAIIVPLTGIKLTAAVAALAPVVAGSICIQSIRFSIWQCQRRPLPAAALQVCFSLLNAGLSLVGVLVLGWGAEGRIIGATAAAVAISLASVAMLLRSGDAKLCLDPHETRTLLRFGVPLIPHSLAGALLGNIDRLAVSTQLDTAALGIYGTAAQLGLVLNVLADAFNKAYLPHMYGLIAQKSIRARLKVVAITYLSIPFWTIAALAIWGVLCMAGELLLGTRYIAAIDLTLWFLIASAFGAVYHNVAAIFFSNNRTDRLSVATVVTTLLSAAVSLPLASAFGVIGGALTAIFAQASMLTLAWFLSAGIELMPWAHPRLAMRALWRDSRSQRAVLAA